MKSAIQGPVYMALGAASLVINDAITKTLTNELSTSQIIFIRSFTIAILCVLFLRLTKRSISNPFSRIVLLRTGFTVGNAFAFVTAISLLPFSVAVLIDYTNILFVALLAPLFLCERLSPVRLFAAITGFCGAFLILAPEFTHMGVVVLLPLLSAILGAGRELCTRHLSGSSVSAEELTLYAGVAMAVFATPGTLISWENLGLWNFAFAILAGVFQGIALILMARAFFLGESSAVAPFRLTAILWTLLLGYFFFGDSITTLQSLGVAVIVAALAVITFDANRSLKESLNSLQE